MEGIPERVSRRLRERREKLGWTKTKAAALAGISQGFLSKIEGNKAGAGPETVIKLAGAYGISMERLYVGESNVEEAPADFRRIPVLDYVQAGHWMSVGNGIQEDGEREQITTNLDLPPSSFALRVRGESMTPRFNDGDVVIINPLLQPHDGDFVVAKDHIGDATFKEYKHLRSEKGEAHFLLVPLNPHFSPLRSDVEPIAIVGVMVEHRSYRRR